MFLLDASIQLRVIFGIADALQGLRILPARNVCAVEAAARPPELSTFAAAFWNVFRCLRTERWEVEPAGEGGGGGVDALPVEPFY